MALRYCLPHFLLLAFAAHAQNYVVNGSFERSPATARGQAQPCAFSSNPDILNNFAEAWQTYNTMTPDLLLIDSTVDCPFLPRPRRGSRMLGLIMYHPYSDGNNGSDYHELIQGTLARPLEKGKTYRVSCWTRTDDSLGVRHLAEVYGRQGSILPVRCGNFGFYFSVNKINPNENFMQSQSLLPVQPQVNRETVVETSAGVWRELVFYLKAGEAYRYFLFGNFFFDAVTLTNLTTDELSAIDSYNLATELVPQKKKRIAYYCFDDFVVTPINPGPFGQTLIETKKLNFSSEVLFDTDQSDLKPGAQASLDQLVEALRSLPELHIEIAGHTDDTGEAAHNQDLSERRAQAVYDYLTGKGLAAARLRWKGYGETRPLAANDTDAGRQKNRRVTCVVLQEE